jgi:hypothetical protein
MWHLVEQLGVVLRVAVDRFLAGFTTSKRTVVLFPMTFDALLPAVELPDARPESTATSSAAMSIPGELAPSRRLAVGRCTPHRAKPRRKKATAKARKLRVVAARTSGKKPTGKVRQPVNFAVKLPKAKPQRAQTRVLKPAPVKRSAAILTFPQPTLQRQLRLKRAA